jgi:hypothetical protein
MTPFKKCTCTFFEWFDVLEKKKNHCMATQKTFPFAPIYLIRVLPLLLNLVRLTASRRLPGGFSNGAD